MSSDIRVLLLADSHLGFDLPVRQRNGRRRRGFDFLANYAAALAPAMAGEVDIVVHAGDVFDRPSVVPSVAYQAYEPLCRIADNGIPVFIVPGNHERSRLPHARFAAHPGVHVFHQPRTFIADIRGTLIALSGFPYERRDVRTGFAELLERTEWRGARADRRLLCIHHCVEGATVGPGDFTFTAAADVIRLRDVPSEFTAVLSGHIHRHQVLITDLERRPVHVPVLYPGSIERTSFAEMEEQKGYVLLRLDATTPRRDVRWEFRPLPARPMIRRELAVDALSAKGLDTAVRSIVAAAPSDAVISIRLSGQLSNEHWRTISAARLRSFVPATMNLDIFPVERFNRREPARESAATATRLGQPSAEGRDEIQLSLY